MAKRVEQYPIIQDAPPGVAEELLWLRRTVYQLQNGIDSLSVPAKTVATITATNVSRETSGSSSSSGVPPQNITQFIGQSAPPQKPFVDEFDSVPPLTDPASQNGNLVSVNGVLYRFDGSVTPGFWEPQGALGTIFQDTYANWTTANYDPTKLSIGTVICITDWTNVLYVIRQVTGVNKWLYLTGTYANALAALPTTGFNGAALGTNDTNLRFFENAVYFHQLQWTGSAWQRGPEDEEHSDTFHEFGAFPTDGGWHHCDGTNVTYLKYDGTTGTRTLPNSDATPAYAKGGPSYSATITAATNPTVGGTTDNTTIGFTSSPATSGSTSINSAAVGTPTTVLTPPIAGGGGALNTDPHSHTLSSATISVAGGDPIAHFSAIRVYRR